MAIQTAKYINVKHRAQELGLDSPSGLALLPRNFETAEKRADLVYESSVADIRALWRTEHVVETRIDTEGEPIPYIQEKKFEWIIPPIFVGAALWSKNPYAITFALGVVANYLTDCILIGLPSWSRSEDVKCDVIVELLKHKDYIKIHYEGSAGELNGLVEKIAQVVQDERKD
jgi:hypothetical protein